MKYSSVGEKLSVSWEGEGAPGLRAQGGSPGGSALDPALPGEADLPLLFPPGPPRGTKHIRSPQNPWSGLQNRSSRPAARGCSGCGGASVGKAVTGQARGCWLKLLTGFSSCQRFMAQPSGGLAGPCAHSTAQPRVCAIASQGCFRSSLSPEPQKFYKVQQTGIPITATLPLMRRVVWQPGWPALSKCFTMPQALLGSK